MPSPTQTPDPAQNPPTPRNSDPDPLKVETPDPSITPEAHKAALEAARQQERQKMHQQLEADRAKREEVAAQLKTQEAHAAALKAELDLLKNKDLSETQKLQTKLAEIQAQNEATVAKMRDLETSTAKALTRAKQESYRAKRLLDTQLVLTDLVPAHGTEAEIDAAIEKALEKEAKIATDAAKAAEKRVREELGKNLPRPVAPGGTNEGSGRPSVRDRRNTAKLSDSEYKEKRAAMLREAKEQAGLS